MAEAESVRDKLATVADPVFLLETLFAEAPVAFAIANADGSCLVVNRAFRELFGGANDIVTAHGLLPCIARAFGGEHVVIPPFWHAADPRIAIEVAMTPLEDRDGAVRHVALSCKDVTAKHALEIELREQQDLRIHEADRLRSEFLAAMSHKLRTPLNGIIGFAELLVDGHVEPGSPQYHDFLADIQTSGRELLQLINDLLDLRKVEAGELEFRPEPVVVTSAIAEVTRLFRTRLLQKRIRVQIEADHALEVIVIDPTRFKQVLYYYLSNALKFTPEGGSIVVRTAPESPDSFRLEVEDSGIGIAPDHIQWLFPEFSPVSSGAHRPPGTGLGLALTRRIVEAQGGTVGVRSSPGQGSVFHAVLPCEMQRDRF